MDAGEGAILRPDAFCQRGSWNQTRGEFMRRSHVLSHEITHHLPSPGGVAFGTQMGSFVSQPSVSGAPSGGACRVGPGPYAALNPSVVPGAAPKALLPLELSLQRSRVLLCGPLHRFLLPCFLASPPCGWGAWRSRSSLGPPPTVPTLASPAWLSVHPWRHLTEVRA